MSPDLTNWCKHCGKEFLLRDDYLIHLKEVHNDTKSDGAYRQIEHSKPRRT